MTVEVTDAFQSTRPVKGATGLFGVAVLDEEVSIHAPREGRDAGSQMRQAVPVLFQSTRPVKGATLGERQPVAPEQVSIHAPR